MGPTEPQIVWETHREAGRGQRCSQGHKELQVEKYSGEVERVAQAQAMRDRQRHRQWWERRQRKDTQTESKR